MEVGMRNQFKRIGTLAMGMVLGASLVGGAAAAGIVAQPTWQSIYVDGQQVEMEAYNINGSNYVKLRDIGKEVGFNVYWQDGVQVDSASDYTGEAPAQVSTEDKNLTQASAASSSTLNIDAVRQEIIQLVNQIRRANGASELTVNDALMNAAQACSDKLYTYHHNREECEAVAASGYPYGFGSNNTVFTGAATADIAQRAVTNWINSPGHFRTMIDPTADCIGVGVTQHDGVTYCYLFVGKPNSINPYS
jgi:uncharacterized protein YkwD